MNYKKIEIFNNKKAIVNYIDELKLVENLWISKVALDSNAYREPFIAALDFASKNSVKYFLSDIRNQGVVPVTEKKWFREVIFPKAAEYGVQYGSVVTSGNVFKTYYMNAIIKVGNVFNLPVKTFNDYEKAFNWLIDHKVHN